MDKLEGRCAIQRDLDRLEEWASKNLITYKMAKCKVPLLGINTCNGTGWEIGCLGRLQNPCAWSFSRHA